MMKLRTFCLPVCLALAWMVICSSGTEAQSLLQKGSQAVMMKGQSDSSGILLLDDFWQITPKGTIQEAHFPDNQNFNLTHIIWYFAATNTEINGPVHLRVGPYYSIKMDLTNGANGGLDNISPGIVFGHVPEGTSAKVVNLANEEIIPGILTITVVGYLTPVP
jgi:hypothetical protein